MTTPKHILTELNTTHGREPYTIPRLASHLSIPEGKLKKLARKAIQEGKLTREAERIWRGWLGLDGAPARRPFAASAAIRGLEDEGDEATPEPGPTVMSGEGGLPLFSVQPEPAVAKGPDRIGAKPRKKHHKGAFYRLIACTVEANYDDLLRAYIGDRTIKQPGESFRRYVGTHASLLPAHIVIKVCPKVAEWLGLAVPKQEVESPPREAAVAPAQVSAEQNALADLEARHETLLRAFDIHRELDAARYDDLSARAHQNHERIDDLRRDHTLLTGLVHAHGMALDALDDELGLTKTPRRLTIPVVSRILRALGAFWRTLVSKEENGL